MTCCRSLGVSGVSAVRDRQVDGEASVIAEAFEAAVFSWVSLPSTLMSRLVQLAMGASDDAVGLSPNFAGAEEEAGCLFRPEGVVFSPCHSQ